MRRYDYVTGINGNKDPYILRMQLNENVDVDEGQLVYYVENKHKVTPTKGNNTMIAGVCAKSYKAEKSELCPEYGTGMIDVIVSPDAVYKTAPFIICDRRSHDSNGVFTDIVYPENGSAAESLIGSKLILIEKSIGSNNGLSIGDEMEVKYITHEENRVTLTFSKDFRGDADDKYLFVPSFGFNDFKILEDGSWIIDVQSSEDFTILEASPEGYYIKFKNVYLGNI